MKTCTRIWGPDRVWFIEGESARMLWEMWMMVPEEFKRQDGFGWDAFLRGMEFQGCNAVYHALITLCPLPAPTVLPDVEFGFDERGWVN